MKTFFTLSQQFRATSERNILVVHLSSLIHHMTSLSSLPIIHFLDDIFFLQRSTSVMCYSLLTPTMCFSTAVYVIFILNSSVTYISMFCHCIEMLVEHCIEEIRFYFHGKLGGIKELYSFLKGILPTLLLLFKSRTNILLIYTVYPRQMC